MFAYSHHEERGSCSADIIFDNRSYDMEYTGNGLERITAGMYN